MQTALTPELTALVLVASGGFSAGTELIKYLVGKLTKKSKSNGSTNGHAGEMPVSFWRLELLDNAQKANAPILVALEKLVDSSKDQTNLLTELVTIGRIRH